MNGGIAMKRKLQTGIAAAIGILALGVPVNAGTLGKLGNAVAYPVKKTVKNAGHNAKQPVKSVESPINQAGQTTSRTTHKVTKKL
jgi:hypothetical protein